MWQKLLALLAALAADPAAPEHEPPRAAAAVAVAYAAQARGKPTPAPQPDPQECCKACNGTGKIVHPDGHVTDCPCPATCECRKPKEAVSVLKSPAEPAAKADARLVQPGGTAVCPDGKCNAKRVR